MAFLFSVASFASETVVKQPIHVGKKTFQAALTSFNNKPATQFIVATMGTGVYCAQKNIPTEFAELAAKNSTAILTLEKPGVDCESAKVIRAEFAEYSREDVVEATALAIVWAEKELGVRAPRVLWGHSEGAQVLTNVVHNHAKLFVDRPIELLLTSPAMNFRELLEFQIPDSSQRETFLEAIKRRDDSFLLKARNGNISAAYWENIFADESLAETLEQSLADEKNLKVALFWGTNDTQCSSNSTCEIVGKLRKKFPERVQGASFNDGHSIENHMDAIANFLERSLRD